MPIYPGTKSLDAEITLNFSDNTICMDYSHNDHGNPYRSNDSVVYNSEWRNLSRYNRIKQALLTTVMMFSIFIISLYVSLITFLSTKNLIRSPRFQLAHQRFLRWYYMNIKGVVIITKRTTTNDSNLLIIPIPNNLWIKYEMEGEFQENIESIALIRHFNDYLRFGKWKELRQNGWDLIFRFKTVPRTGFVKVQYID